MRLRRAHDGQRADVVVDHDCSSNLDGTVRTDRDHIVLHDLAYRKGSGLGAGFHPADGSIHGGKSIQQVLLGDDADQQVVFDDRKTVDVARAHQVAVSYTHLRAHETRHDLVCRLLLEKKKKKKEKTIYIKTNKTKKKKKKKKKKKY